MACSTGPDKTIEAIRARTELAQATLDALNALQSATPPPTPLPETGRWLIRESVYPMNDKSVIVASLKADKSPGTLGEIELILRCKNLELDIWIEWNRFLGPDLIPGRTSIRKGASFNHENVTKRAFIEQLAAADRLVARVTPYIESPITAEFDLTSMQMVTPRFLEQCPY